MEFLRYQEMNKYNIPYVKMFEYTKIIGLENIDFGKNIIIDDFVLIYAKEKIKIGSFVHIASFSSISGGGELIMEEFSGLASGMIMTDCPLLTSAMSSEKILIRAQVLLGL